MGMPPYFMPLWALPPGSAAPFVNGGMPAPGTLVTPSPIPRPSHSAHASTSSVIPVYPSSDPPDMGAINPYTEIPEFIQQLHEYYLKRRLSDYIGRFEDLDFYNIDEITKLGSPDNLAELVRTTVGNAAFLLEKIRAEMKRIDRVLK